MRRRKPTLATLEVVLGPAVTWAGRCYEVASACVAEGLVDGVAVYGHYLGEVAETSHFGARRGLPFQRHGWVRRPGGEIFDPTRWTFTGEAPGLFFGEAGHPDYDEGGNRHRGEERGGPPRFDAEERTYDVDDRKLSSGAWSHVEELLGADYTDGHEPGVLCESQLLWLANQPYDTLAPYTREVYRMFKLIGCSALVPIDNMRRAEREEDEVKKSRGTRVQKVKRQVANPAKKSSKNHSAKRPVAEEPATQGRGRPRQEVKRKQSHVPLYDAERDKLHRIARQMNMSYAVWARATLLAVADFPLAFQPANPAARFTMTSWGGDAQMSFGGVLRVRDESPDPGDVALAGLANAGRSRGVGTALVDGLAQAMVPEDEEGTEPGGVE